MSALTSHRTDGATADAAEAVIALATIAGDEAALRRTMSALRLPDGLAREVVRAANDVVAPLRPEPARARIVLEMGQRSIAMDPDVCAFESDDLDLASVGVEIRRGRNGARIIRTSDQEVLRNGWPLATGAPASLQHGDVVETAAGPIAVRSEPGPGRSPIALGAVRVCVDGPGRWPRFVFVLEPYGSPIVVSIDPATCRALVDLALDGDGSRAFDASLLGEVEHAVVEWIVRQVASSVSSHVLGGTLAFALSDEVPESVALACRAAIRVGGFSGAVSIATDASGAAAIARSLGAQSVRALRRHPALGRFTAQVALCVDLGVVTAAEFATLDRGDHFVLRGACARPESAGSLWGHLAVPGTPVKVRANVLRTGDRLLARISTNHFATGVSAMEQHVEPRGAAAADPFASLMDDVHVTVAVELARRTIPIAELLSTREGDVVEFAAPVGVDVALMIDGSVFARGELVSFDGMFAVRVHSIGAQR